MPQYILEDAETKRRLVVEGNRAPTESEIEALFEAGERDPNISREWIYEETWRELPASDKALNDIAGLPSSAAQIIGGGVRGVGRVAAAAGPSAMLMTGGVAPSPAAFERHQAISRQVPDTISGRLTQPNQIVDAGHAIEDAAAKAFQNNQPESVNRPGRFVAEAVGNVGGALAAGPAALAFGTVAELNDAYERELQRQITAKEEPNPEKAFIKATVYSGSTVPIEMGLGVGRILRKVKQYFGSKVADEAAKKALTGGKEIAYDFLKERMKDSAAGFSQEFAEALIQDLIVEGHVDLANELKEALAGAIGQTVIGGAAQGTAIAAKQTGRKFGGEPKPSVRLPTDSDTAGSQTPPGQPQPPAGDSTAPLIGPDGKPMREIKAGEEIVSEVQRAFDQNKPIEQEKASEMPAQSGATKAQTQNEKLAADLGDLNAVINDLRDSLLKSEIVKNEAQTEVAEPAEPAPSEEQQETVDPGQAEQPLNALSDALQRYEDTGEIETVRDLVDEVDNMIETGRAPGELRSAVDAYREAAKEDFEELGGRGDMDAADEAFLGAMRKAAGVETQPTPTATPAQPQSTQETSQQRIDVSAITNAETEDAMVKALGEVVSVAKTKEEIAQAKAAASQWKEDGKPTAEDVIDAEMGKREGTKAPRLPEDVALMEFERVASAFGDAGETGNAISDASRRSLFAQYRAILEKAVANKKPVDVYGWTQDLRNSPPEGYVKEGLRYIYKGKEARKPTAADVIDSEMGKTANKTPSEKVADFVFGRLSDNSGFTYQELFDASDKAFGGTQAEGKYSVKDAYDAMELGVNRYVESLGDSVTNADAEQAKQTVRNLKALIEKVPTQTKRTAEQDEFQQFSTPPPFAYVVNWVAGVRSSDVVLEPSGGVGGIAIFAKAAGATVMVNELSPRRRALLERMGFARVFGENAEQLHNVLPADVRPTVVEMNPPFSSTGGRMQGQRSTANGARHIEQALKRLEPGGRLVAIVGEGMAADRPAFKTWWAQIRKQYNVRANIGLSGGEYRKYGTTFDNQILVIDKTGPTTQEPVTGKVDNTEQLVDLLYEVRNERKRASSEPSSEPARGGTAPEGESSGRTASPASVPTDATGAGESGPGVQPEVSTGAGTRRNVSEPEPGPGKPASIPAADRQPGGTGPERIPSGDRSNSGRAAAPGGTAQQVSGDSAGLPQPGSESLEFKATEKKASGKELTDAVYDDYQPSLAVKGARPHPTSLSESAAMGAVTFPPVSYKPSVPQKTIEAGELSDAQLEPVILAGEAHKQTLDDEAGSRRGFFIGDGTGVGKGREIAGIILDNTNKGRKKHVWISEKTGLAKDARRDIAGVGLDPDSLIELSKIKAGAAIPGNRGVLFLTYDTLKGGEKVEAGRKGKSRLDQIVEWLGEDFDGVIAFDEAHNMGNAIEMKGKRGKTKPAQKALSGLALQRALPKARVIYVSATGATEVQNLSYAQRLGLWGPGTPFSTVKNFIDDIGSAGLAAMEKVAADMKALGLYIARNLNFKGVEYERLEHALTPQQETIYNELARAWQLVLREIDSALKLTDGYKDRNAKSAAASAFWGSHQRFFNQVITSMKMPTLLTALEKDLAEGRAAVLQLVNTQEAMSERAIAQSQSEGGDLDDFDMTPRQQLLQMIEKSFPVTQYETYTDEDGNERSRVVEDSNGNPVKNPEAVAMRDALIDRLGSIRVPDGPLEMLLNHFGTDKVAEVTGRGRRVVKGPDGKRIVETRGKSGMEADADAFMADRKQILVFSQAGGTGRSYHADLKAKNQRPRVHYLVQPGWRADAAVQGFGRTHRSNQKQPPKYLLLTTNLPGERRFISSIARRLDQLGALTKGSRKTGGQGFFQMRDNLESSYAKDALDVFIRDLQAGRIPDLDMATFESQTGLRLTDDRGALVGEIDITKFLNRLLSLDIPTMNKVFDAYSERMDTLIQHAIEQGTLDQGLENLTAQKTEKVNEQVVYTEPKTKAQTKHVELRLTHPTNLRAWSTAEQLARGKKFIGFVRNIRSGKVWAVSGPFQGTDRSGAVGDHFKLTGVRGVETRPSDELSDDKFEKLTEDEAETLWRDEYGKAPKTYSERVDLVAGVILPIWDRLPQGKHKLVRAQTENGERIIGRVIPRSELTATLSRLGAEASGTVENPREAFVNVRDNNFRLTLANDWVIRRSRVSGEDRIELIGPDYSDLNELHRYGVFTERIQWKTRFFIPTSEDGANTLEQIARSKPIVQAQPPTIIADSVEEALDRAIDATDPLKGDVMEGVTGMPIWLTKTLLNGALKVARASYKAGKAIAQCVADAVEWLRSQNPKGFDEAEATEFLTAEVERRRRARSESAQKAAATRREKQLPESPEAANKSWRERAKKQPSKQEEYTKGVLARAVASVVHGDALPKAFREARQWGLSFQKFIEESLRVLILDARKALNAEFKTNQERLAAEDRLLAYWTGQAELNTVGGPALQRAAEAFRQTVDQLTTLAVRNGIVPEGLEDTWLGNRGAWLKRTYLAFDPTADWNYDTLKRRAARGDAEIRRIWSGIVAYLERQNPQMEPAELEAIMRSLIDRREVEDILGLSAQPLAGSGKRFSVDISSLLRRKDLPIEVREWMGEIKDPFARGLQSGKWMAQFITRNLVQRKFARLGLEMGLLSESPNGRKTVELYPNINQLVQARDEEGNPITTEDGQPVAEWRQKVDRRREPLHGFYSSPEFAAALQEFDGMFHQMHGALDVLTVGLKTYLKGIGYIKAAKVGLNPFSYMLNTIGGIVMRLAAGGVNPVHFKDALSAIASGNNPVDGPMTSKQAQARMNYLLATKAGVTGRGVLLGDVRTNLERDTEPEEFKRALAAIRAILSDPKGGGAWVRLRDALTDIAQIPGNYGIKFMDDVFRVSAFLDELALARKAFPDQSEQQHVEWAADRASNVYQSYDRLLPVLRGLSRASVLNTFISFKFELFRNTYWIARYAAQGISSDNAALKQDGYKKAVGLMAMVGAPFALAALSRAENDTDDDEVGAFQRWAVPPWDRGEELVIVSRNGTRWRYVPMGYMLPHYEITRAINAGWKAAHDPNPDIALRKAVQGMAADYFGPGAFLGPGIEALTNKRIGGGQITYAEDWQGVKDRAAYLRRAWGPNIGDPLYQAYMGMTDQKGTYGREYDIAEVGLKLAGIRVRTVDVARQLPFSMREFGERWKNATAYANIAKRKHPSDQGRQDVAKAYRVDTQAELQRQYAQFYRDMLKLGVSEQQFLIAEKEVKLPKELKYSRIAQ